MRWQAIVIRIKRLRHNDFVPGIKARHESEEQGLGSAGRHDEIFLLHMKAKAAIVLGKFFHQARKTTTWAVFNGLDIRIPHSFHELFGCRKVGLANIEVIDMNATAFGAIGIRDKLADGAWRHFKATLGNLWHTVEFSLRQNYEIGWLFTEPNCLP
jgi:hypothetical protein